MKILVKDEGNYIDFNIVRFYVQEAQYKFDKGAFEIYQVVSPSILAQYKTELKKLMNLHFLKFVEK